MPADPGARDYLTQRELDTIGALVAAGRPVPASLVALLLAERLVWVARAFRHDGTD